MGAFSPVSFVASLNRIKKLCKDGLLQEALQVLNHLDQKGISISRDIFYNLLQACAEQKNLIIARQLQGYRIGRYLRSVAVLGDHLIRIFTSCGSLHEANEVFATVPNPSVYTWNSIISAHISFGEYEKAIELHKQMQDSLTRPNEVTFLYCLKACSCLRLTEKGKQLHKEITELGLELDVAIGSTLIDMYVKCGKLKEAQKSFDSLPNQNIVSWGALVTGYAANGHATVVLDIFAEMKKKGIQPSKVIYIGILKACASLGDLERGRFIHFQMRKDELGSDVIIGTSLIDMYSKCGSVEESYIVFTQLPSRNVMSWGAMINALIHNGRSDAALDLFDRMQREGIPSDRVILSCILKACGNNYSKEYGRILHDSVSRNGWASDTVVGSSLIDMYVNFGNLEEALWVFHSLPHKNIVSWGALMEGYVQQEDGISALFLFEKMLHEGIELDNMIFICVSKACAITESIFQGKIIHSHIVYNGLDADVSIASSLVDMYVKCGNVHEACKVFDCIEDPDIISWGSVVTAYALVGNHKMVRKGLDVILQNGIQLDAVIFTTILTACGHEGLVEEGLYYFKYMRAFQEFQPNIEHYNCIIDLLSRAGRLYDANAILATMPIRTNITGWICLLASCKIYGDTELASRCLDHMAMLKHSGCFVGVMSLAFSDPSLSKHTQQTSIDVNYYMYDFRVAENAIDMTSTIGDHPLPIVCYSSP